MSAAELKEAVTGKAIERDDAKSFPALLDLYKKQIQLALPKHLDANRMARVALTCYRMSPLLAKCSPASVFACVIQASQLGLEPGINGEAYLVPFWSTKNKQYECQLIPGYRGLIKLARNTSQIESVSSRIVYSNDKFDVVLGTEERITHVPMLTGERGVPVLAYCIARFKDGGFHFEPMTWKDVIAIKARTKSRNKDGDIVGPWVTDEEEMARKTVVRRASKYWPMSVELATAVALDNAAAMGIAQELDTAAIIAGESFIVPNDIDGGQGDPSTEVSGQSTTEVVAAIERDLFDDKGGPITITALLKMIDAAKDADELNLCRDLIRELKNKKEQEVAVKAVAAKAAA